MIVWHCSKCMEPMFDYLADGVPKRHEPMLSKDWQHHETNEAIMPTTMIVCPHCKKTPKAEPAFLREHDDKGVHIVAEIV